MQVLDMILRRETKGKVMLLFEKTSTGKEEKESGRKVYLLGTAHPSKRVSWPSAFTQGLAH
jgi:hypothetical protein